MPQPNKFICTNFEIISQDMDVSLLPQYPVKLFKNDFFECFYKLDGRFKLPHAIFKVYLVSALTATSVQKTILTSIYCSVAKHYVAEKLYPAVAAGLNYEMTTEDKGLLITLSGYDEKLPLLLESITKELKNIGELAESKVFEMYRSQLKKECYNNVVEAEFLNQDCRLNLIEENHKFYLDRYTETDEVSFDDFKSFAGEFLNHLQVQILVQGNISRTSAIELSHSVMHTLNCSKTGRQIELESRTRKIPSGSNVLCVSSVLADDGNSVVTNYVQLGPITIRLHCLAQLIQSLMDDPVFDVLRTQEQLGYVVYCARRINYGILGFSVTVQSQENKNSTTFVSERIEKFLHEGMVQVLEELSDEDFADAQSSFVKMLKMDDVDLESEATRFWSEIASKEYFFDLNELKAQMVARLTKQEVIEFYKTKIIATDARKLSIQVVGNAGSDDIEVENVPKLQVLVNHPIAAGQKLIKDVKAFKASLEMYPITKTVNDL